MNIVKRWFYSDAKWWMFWKPRSGIVGGLIMASIINVPLMCFVY